MTVEELITSLSKRPLTAQVYINDDGTEYPIRYIGPAIENEGVVLDTLGGFR